MTYGAGWLEWKGGAPCPVKPGVMIQIEYGPSASYPGDISAPARASTWAPSYWTEPGNISKWRLAGPREEKEFRDSQEQTAREWGIL